jgi:hypothetical protein
VQRTIQRCGQVVSFATMAVIGLALTGFFGLMYLWTAAHLYSQVHLWWQPAVIAGTAVLEFVILGLAILRAATTPREMVDLFCVILIEFVFNMFFTAAFIPIPIL